MNKIISFLLSFSILLTSVPSVFAYDGTQNEYYEAAIRQYDAYDYSDPQVISDETMFGVWDGESWIEGPLLDYENYPGLSQVEEEAKAGDYDRAKETLLIYYREVFKNYHYVWGTNYNTPEYILAAECAMENLWISSVSLPFARITVDAEKKWITADATYAVEQMLAGDYGSSTFMIVDLKKDDYMAEFHSRNSNETDAAGISTAPRLEVVVNGGRRTYYASDDTYVKGGDDLSSNFGLEDKLYCEESVSSIGAQAPIDNNSKRSYIRFDMSDIDTNDQISDATLYLYGQMIASECVQKNGEEKESIDLMIFDDSTRYFSESSLTWVNTSSDSVFSYDGEVGPRSFVDPTPNSFRWTASILNPSPQINCLANLYYRTGEEAYVYHWVRIITNTAALLGNTIDGNGQQTSQPLYQAACRIGENLCKSMPQIINSQYITPEALTIILKYVHVTLDALVSEWDIEGEGTNIGMIINKHMLSTAYMFREFKRFSDPLEDGVKYEEYPGSKQGGWRDVGLWRAIYKLQDAVNPDGSGEDVPLGYLQTTIENFYGPFYFIESSLNTKIDNIFNDDSREILENVVEFAIGQSNPVGSVWQQGDDGNWQGSKVSSMIAFLRNLLGSTDLIKWYESGHTEGKAPDFTSYANDTVARAVLRNSWDENAVAVQLNADAAYKSHGHYDDLAFNMMAYGKYLLADKNIGSYESNEGQWNWQRSTRAHNTVEINDTSQKAYISSNMNLKNYYDDPLHGSINKADGPGTLHPENREFNDSYDFMRAETEGYINNAALKEDFRVFRDVLFIKSGYFIVTDYIEPETDTSVNKYSQAWHYYPDSNAVLDPDTLVTHTNYNGEANVVVAPVGGQRRNNGKTA